MGLTLPPAKKPKKNQAKEQATEDDLGGFRLLTPLFDLLAALRDESDPKRKFHQDDLLVLLLLRCFNPTLDSLRSLQAASDFPQVRKKLGIPRVSLGSLSAAQHTLEGAHVAEMFGRLLEGVPASGGDTRLQQLKAIVTLADGTLLKALPRMAWALWLPKGKNAAKAHVQFELLKGLPCHVDVTAGNTSEREVFMTRVESNRLYVMDSGYASFALFQAVVDKGSNFVARLPNGWKHEVIEERALTDLDREARVLSDRVVALGGPSSRASSTLKQPVRLVEIQRVDEPSRRMRSERGVRDTIVLVTDQLDLSADLIAHLYACRWQIEIFFRWLKCTLGCKHLIFKSANGLALQLYSALIACLLISLWTGRKPTKRMYEAICLYFQGWADLEDVMALAKNLPAHTLPA